MNLHKIVVTGLLAFLATVVYAEDVFRSDYFCLNGKSYRLEIAETPAQRQLGLMHREQLADNAGMLFVYERAGDYRIWMKNTLIPLTVIWLDKQQKIIDIKLLQPCETYTCPVYGVKKPSQYIIELSNTELERFTAGDQFSIDVD